MSTVNLKYSWFLDQKGTNKINRLVKKYYKKWDRVNSILINSQVYGIELSEITKNQIMEKKILYSNQTQKLRSFEYMFKQKGKDEAMRYIEKLFTKEEVRKYKTEGGVLKILRKLF